MTKKEKAEQILERYNESEAIGRKVYWVKASCLFQWKRDNSYEMLFDGAGTWNEFLGNLGVAPSSAGQKIKNWEFFIVRHGYKVAELEDKDTSCLYYVAKTDISNKAKVQALVNKIGKVSRSEFIDVLSGKEKCDHSETAEVNEEIEKCLKCGKKLSQHF